MTITEHGTVESPTRYSEQSTGTGSPQITRLRAATAGLRDQFNVFQEDSEALHHVVQDYDLNDRAAIKARNGASALLDELYSHRGLGWNDIATAARVSLSAVRKWRKNGECLATNRLTLARLAALLDLVEEALITDPGGWLLTPLIEGYNVRYLDLVAAGKYNLVLDWAFQRKTATQVMDMFDTDWRTSRRRKFDVVVDGDGVRSLRRASG